MACAARPIPRDAQPSPAGGEPRAPPGRAARGRHASRRWCALPMPAPLVFDGQRLPASYANFYIANAAVLVPDLQRSRGPRGALGILARAVPRPPGGRHPRRRPGVGPGHAALPDPAAAGALDLEHGLNRLVPERVVGRDDLRQALRRGARRGTRTRSGPGGWARHAARGGRVALPPITAGLHEPVVVGRGTRRGGQGRAAAGVDEGPVGVGDARRRTLAFTRRRRGRRHGVAGGRIG